MRKADEVTIIFNRLLFLLKKYVLHQFTVEGLITVLFKEMKSYHLNLKFQLWQHLNEVTLHV